jgi:hypothetical protein
VAAPHRRKRSLATVCESGVKALARKNFTQKIAGNWIIIDCQDLLPLMRHLV